MKEVSLHINLLSETAVGTGHGGVGGVDTEIEHDRYGLPLIPGRALQGLLRQSWEEFSPVFTEFAVVGNTVFGRPGDNRETCITRIGDGQVPDHVRAVVKTAVTRENRPMDPDRVLMSLTTIRGQTAQDRRTGARKKGTLRNTRVLIPGVLLIAPVTWLREPSPEEERCFAMAVLGVRHLGSGVTRGRGHVRIDIDGDREHTERLAGLGEVIT